MPKVHQFGLFHAFWATTTLIISACSGPSAPPPSSAPPPPSTAPASAQGESSVSLFVERSLPAVALVLGEKEKGKIGYGAGLILSKDGRILTNHHVIEGMSKLGVMLYNSKRHSYTPMDGGLERYIFEHAKDILPVSVLKQDPITDLALLKGEFDTSFAPILPFAREAPRIASPVFALGHPQETVWSFTQGVVSALHAGAIQHDAVVSRGSSGGPLLNAQGEVIGINTARVISEARGFAFARPILMANKLLQETSDSTTLDRRTPEQAMFSCWHALELELPDAKNCYDETALWAVFVNAVELLGAAKPSALPAEILQKLRAFVGEPGAMERVHRYGASDALWSRLKTTAPPFAPYELLALRAGKFLAADDPGKKIEPELKEIQEARAILRQRMADLGIRVEMIADNPQAVRETLRKGGRIDDTKWVDKDRVWFLVTGRNVDNSTYRYSELWVRRDDLWYQREPPLAADVLAVPDGWPKPLRVIDALARALAADIAARLGGQDISSKTK